MLLNISCIASSHIYTYSTLLKTKIFPTLKPVFCICSHIYFLLNSTHARLVLTGEARHWGRSFWTVLPNLIGRVLSNSRWLWAASDMWGPSESLKASFWVLHNIDPGLMVVWKWSLIVFCINLIQKTVQNDLSLCLASPVKTDLATYRAEK